MRNSTFHNYFQILKMSEQPKRPQVAFFIWLSSNRASILQENPGFKATEVSKKAGEIWRGLSDKDKSEWQAKAAVAKRNYEIAIEEFKQNGGEMKAVKRKKAPLKDAPVSPEDNCCHWI